MLAARRASSSEGRAASRITAGLGSPREATYSSSWKPSPSEMAVSESTREMSAFSAIFWRPARALAAVST